MKIEVINMRRNILLFLVVAVFSSEVYAAAYKCTNNDGKVSFQGAPCESDQSQSLIKQEKPKARTCSQKWKNVSDDIVEKINNVHKEKRSVAQQILENAKLGKNSSELAVVDFMHSELVDPIDRFHTSLIKKMKTIPDLYESTNEDQSMKNCKADEFSQAMILGKFESVWDETISSLEENMK